MDDIVWQKVQAVIVPPEAFSRPPFSELSQTVSKEREGRVFIVQGAPHTGATTCAIYLGWELLGKPDNPNYIITSRNRSETRMLFDFVQQRANRQDKEKNTVYLMERGFENGVKADELSQLYLPVIQKLLKSNNNYLIITTNDKDICQELTVPALSTRVGDFTNTIDRHLEWYRQHIQPVRIAPELLEQVSTSKKTIFSGFPHPHQINQYFIELGKINAISYLTETLKPGETLAQIQELPEPERQKREQEALVHLGQSMLRPLTESPRAWFEKLPENTRLYAMLVGLFQNVERETLEELYNIAVRTLRDDGITNLFDHRQSGRDDRLEAIHAEEKEDHLIYFESDAYLAEIQRQIDNRHNLLWSLIGDWAKIILILKEFRGNEVWELRRCFGAAIGRLGIHYLPDLRRVLNEIALHESGRVVAVAGYALEEICRLGKQNHGLVMEIIERWAKSHHPDNNWAAADTIWRVYGPLTLAGEEGPVSGNSADSTETGKNRKRLWQLLKGIAENCGQYDLKNKVLQSALKDFLKRYNRADDDKYDHYIENLEGWRTLGFPSKIAHQINDRLDGWAHDNAISVIFSILNIADVSPKDAVAQIKEWLEFRPSHKNNPGSNMLDSIAKQAGFLLFDSNSQADMPLLEERHLPLLELVAPLLASAPETASTVARTLLVWTKQSGWPEKIYAALLKVMDRETSKVGIALRTSLMEEHWLESDNPEIVRLGQALLVRSYAMDGTPMEIPGHGCALFAVDASNLGYLNNAHFTGHQVASALGARLDTYAFYMGSARPAALPGAIATSTSLCAAFKMPCLLVPAIEARDIPAERHPNLRTLVGLAWDQILDLGDLDDTPYEEKLLLVGPKLPEKARHLWEVVPIQQSPHLEDLRAIEAKLDYVLGHQLGKLEQADWEQMLGEQDLTPEQAIASLETLAVELDTPSNPPASPDPARRMIALGFWLAKADWSRLIEWVKGALKEAKPGDTPYQVSKAVAKLLFKVQAAAQPVPPPEGLSQLLELIEPLTHERNDWGAVQCVLDAFRLWLTEPAWKSTSLERWLALLVDNTPPADTGELQKYIQAWQDKEQPETIRQAAGRLEARLELGKSGAFPELPEGKKYALVLLDTSQNRNQDLAMAGTLFNQELAKYTALNDSYVTIFGRLGQSEPVMIKGKALETSDLWTDELPHLPVLAAPFLEHVVPGSVGFVLLLTNSAILDQEDWAESWKHTHILVCSNVRRPPELPAFVRRLSWTETPEKTTADIVTYIRDFLKG